MSSTDQILQPPWTRPVAGLSALLLAAILAASCARGAEGNGRDACADAPNAPDGETAFEPLPDTGDPAGDDPSDDADAEISMDQQDEEPFIDLAVDETPADMPPDSPDPVEEPVEVPLDVPADDGGGGPVLASWSFATCPEGWSAASLGHVELPSLSWECGAPASGPGSDHGGGGNLFATRLGGNYRDFEWSALTSPPVDLSGVTGPVTLTFWHWYRFEWCTDTCGAENPTPDALDGGNVEAWDGSSWVLITPAGGYPGTLSFFDVYYTHPLKDAQGYNAEGTQSTWLLETFDVTPHVNAAFRVRFVFGSDSGVSDAGWYIDDIVLSSP